MALLYILVFPLVGLNVCWQLLLSTSEIKKSKPLPAYSLMRDSSVCAAFNCHFKRIISCSNSLFLLRAAILAVIRACTVPGMNLCGTVS